MFFDEVLSHDIALHLAMLFVHVLSQCSSQRSLTLEVTIVVNDLRRSYWARYLALTFLRNVRSQ